MSYLYPAKFVLQFDAPESITSEVIDNTKTFLINKMFWENLTVTVDGNSLVITGQVSKYSFGQGKLLKNLVLNILALIIVGSVALLIWWYLKG